MTSTINTTAGTRLAPGEWRPITDAMVRMPDSTGRYYVVDRATDAHLGYVTKQHHEWFTQEGRRRVTTWWLATNHLGVDDRGRHPNRRAAVRVLLDATTKAGA